MVTRPLLILSVLAGAYGTLETPDSRNPRIVTLNVGGTLYTTSPTTLTKYPDSLLALDYRAERNSYFYDRDGEVFRHVLNYLRTDKLLLPGTFHLFDLLLEEARFFNLYSLHDDILEFQRKTGEYANIPSGGDNLRHVSEEEEHPHQRSQAKQDVDELPEDNNYDCVIVCADEDGKVERWFSAPIDLGFENNGCLLGDCENITSYSQILDYRDYMARPGNTVPNHFNIAAIVTRLLRAGFDLISSSSSMEDWHREFFFVFVRRIKKNAS